MTCRDIEDRVALYAGGDLDAESARDVERHVESCPACRGLLAEMREQREAMAEWRDAEPSEDALRRVRDGVLAGITRGDARPGILGRIGYGPFRPVVWGLAGLAAAALLVFAVWASVSRTPDVQPAQRAAAQSARAASPAAVETAARTAAPAPSSRATSAAKEPSATRPRPEATSMSAAGESMASRSRDRVGEIRTAVGTSDAPPGPLRRIEIQTADPNIRIIWLVPETAPDPHRSGADAR